MFSDFQPINEPGRSSLQISLYILRVCRNFLFVYGVFVRKRRYMR